MENWVYEKETLKLIGRHWQTGEYIPDEMISIIQNISTFHEAYATIRQLNFAILDMQWHTLQRDISVPEITEFESKALANTQILPRENGVMISPAFSHIFAGGYAAGYYGYKYAEMLDADAYQYCISRGNIFDQDIAGQFRQNILSKGGIQHPLQLYKNFRGQEPTTDALMQRISGKK
jgi:peptidyl-dipeptidase Dcp